MVKSSSLLIKLFLVLVIVMLSAVSMAPSLPIYAPNKDGVGEEDESAVRIERSTNTSRLTGTGSKIRMYIMEQYLQIFADGVVNATDDESSLYTILQRTSVNVGQVKIQGVATCTFLCMDSCGLLYSTREFQDECVFHESLEMDYYNVYSSVRHSDHKRTFYLGISKNSTPRKIEIKGNAALGKYSSYATVLPQPVDHQTIRDLENSLLATTQPNKKSVNRHSLRHHQLCPPPHHTKITISNKCRKQLKKKKRKKTIATEDDENEDSAVIKKGGKKRRTEKKKPKPTEEAVTTFTSEADPEDEEK